MTISISSVSSYYSTSYIDDGYIASEIVLGATSVSSVNSIYSNTSLTSALALPGIGNATHTNSLSISNSYYDPRYVDWNYISPDVINAIASVSSPNSSVYLSINSVGLTTSVSSVKSSLSLGINSVSSSSNITPLVSYVEIGLYSVTASANILAISPIVNLDSVYAVSTVSSAETNITVGLSSVSATSLVSYVVHYNEVAIYSDSILGDTGDIVYGHPISTSYFLPYYIDWDYTNPDTTPLKTSVSTFGSTIVVSLNGVEGYAITLAVEQTVPLDSVYLSTSVSYVNSLYNTVSITSVTASANILAISPTIRLNPVLSSGSVSSVLYDNTTSISSVLSSGSVSSLIPVVLLDSNDSFGLVSSIDSVYNTILLTSLSATGDISNLKPLVTPITYPLELINTAVGSIDGVFISPPISGSYYLSRFIDRDYTTPEILADTTASTGTVSPVNTDALSTVSSIGSISDLTPIVKLDSVSSIVSIEPILSITTIGISSVSAAVTTLTSVAPTVPLVSFVLVTNTGILGVQIQNDTILDDGYFYPGFIEWNYITPDFTAGSGYISSVNTNLLIQLDSFELSTQIANLDVSNSISISESYYQAGFIDWNYISPDIITGVATVSSLIPAVPLDSFLLTTEIGNVDVINESSERTLTNAFAFTEVGTFGTLTETSELQLIGELSTTDVGHVNSDISTLIDSVVSYTDVGSLDVINSSFSGADVVGIQSTVELGNLQSVLSDNTNPNQINANISSVSIQLSTDIQSSNIIGYPGSIGKSNVVTISTVYSQSDVGTLTAISESTTSIQLIGNTVQSSVGNSLASTFRATTGQELSSSIGLLTNDRTIGISSTTGQSSVGSIGTTTDGSITLGLSGISVQSYAGNISKLVDCSASGNQSQSDVGYVLSLHQTTTILATTSVGSVNSTVDHSISSIVGNTSLGNLTFGKSDSILGNETNNTIGSLSNYSSLLLNGITNQSSIGTLTKNIDIGLSGTQSVGYVNSILESNSTQLSSNIATIGLGTLGFTKSDSIRLSQVNSVVSQGTISTNISISVSGITSYGLIQSEIPVEVIVPSGNEASISQGQFTVSSSSTVNLTSVLGTSSIHSVDSVISRIATSYQLATNVGSLSNSSDVVNTGILSAIVQQPLFATHTVESTGYQIQSDIGSVIESFGANLYAEPLVGYTGNLNKYSTTSIFGSLSSISNGNIGTNLLASIYNPTLIASFGYLAHFIESDDIYYYGPVQFELINSNIIPFAVSLPIETGFDDTKEIETKFNTVFTSDMEFKNTKSFKGVCL